MFNSPQVVLAAWLDGVNAGEADRLLELYAEGSVLVPTFSEKILNDRVGIEAYFLGLSKRGVSRVTLKEGTLNVLELANGVFALAGLYDWKFQDGELVKARFTFTVNVHKASPITHHHSSVLPRSDS
ncbi:MAG TPA: DUF4440 domain-containing protein [Opitutae bacterium]|nr:DUF4440 domain-containing protein [Opitutae bacterium]|tara:strand:- start:64 stop:444 length:381 start_codon:yes stop_codon:yes gene_type:complete